MIHIISLTTLFFIGLSTISYAQKRGINDGLSIGEFAPPINGFDILGKQIKWANELKKGPVVVVFYRGSWCPFCNRYLKQLDDMLKESEFPATLIALSPQLPEFSEDDIKDRNYGFQVLYDEGGYFMKSYRSVSTESQISDYKEKHPEWIEMYNEDLLPVPATYIIDKNGYVVSRHFDEDYKIRMQIEEIRKTVSQLISSSTQK